MHSLTVRFPGCPVCLRFHPERFWAFYCSLKEYHRSREKLNIDLACKVPAAIVMTPCDGVRLTEHPNSVYLLMAAFILLTTAKTFGEAPRLCFTSSRVQWMIGSERGWKCSEMAAESRRWAWLTDRSVVFTHDSRDAGQPGQEATSPTSRHLTSHFLAPVGELHSWSKEGKPSSITSVRG